MFQEALQFKVVIILYYSRQNIVRISGRVPPLLTWHISKIIVDSLSPIVIVCVLNQSKSHQLLSDALQSTIIMCLKFKEKMTNPYAPITLINDDYGITLKLYLFVSNIKREICSVLDSFLLKKNLKIKLITCFFNARPQIQKPLSSIFFC